MSDTPPLDIDKTYNEAEQAFAAGKLMLADDLCSRILTADAGHSGALHLAGLLALRRRNGQAAVDLLMRAVEAAPENVPYRVHLATAQGAVGKVEDAVRTLEEAIGLDADSDEAHYNLGLMRLHAGEPEAALTNLRRATVLNPGAARIHLNLGAALQQAGKAEETIGAFAEAARIDPDWPLAHAHLADALEAVGRIEEARSAAGRALALRPSQARAEMVLARLDLHDGWPEAARDRLRKVVGGTARTPVHEAALNGLGHALDRLGNHDEAFDAFAKSRKQRAATPLAAHADHEKTLRHIADCREWFSAARTSNWPEASIDQAPAPIFVVGFPRSGAELVERLLAAHPDFIVAKGQPWLARMLATVEGPLPRILGDLDEAEIGRLRAAYRAEVEATLGDAAEGRRVVDRNPLNLLELGAVRRIFPEAKVLTRYRAQLPDEPPHVRPRPPAPRRHQGTGRFLRGGHGTLAAFPPGARPRRHRGALRGHGPGYPDGGRGNPRFPRRRGHFRGPGLPRRRHGALAPLPRPPDAGAAAGIGVRQRAGLRLAAAVVRNPANSG